MNRKNLKAFLGLLAFFASCCVAFAQGPVPVTAPGSEPGRRQYDNNCSVCHGGNGAGGELAPSILQRLPALSDTELTDLLRKGIPDRGMPAFAFGSQDMTELISFLRTLRTERRVPPPERKKVVLTDGSALEGLVLGESAADLSLQDSPVAGRGG